MPKSRKRTPRHPALAGIPQRILDRSPRDWSDARRAAWCRAYVAGAASGSDAMPARYREFQLAYRQGRADAASLSSEVAQVADTRKSARRRSESIERQRPPRRSDIIEGLEALSARHMIPSAPGRLDDAIMSMAAASLGMGLIGMGRRG